MSPDPDRNGSSRRELLAHGVSLSTLAALGGAAHAQEPAARAVLEGDAGEGDALDDALARLHARLPDTSPHFANHVPMVLEALSVLDRPRAIRPWLDDNLPAGGGPAPERAPIDAFDWRSCLARPERFADWHAFFARELEADDWRAVVARWAPRLVPGLAGSATHGVIRTGHAARALTARDNAIRRRELAMGLAYWAATYQELPWDGSLAPEPSVEAALTKVALRRPAAEPPRGNIVTGLAALEETPSFRPVAGLLDTRDPLRTLHEITAAFAQLFLRHPERPIHFTHAVTAPSSLRLLLPVLDEETARTALRHAWQAAAGLYVVYGTPHAAPVEPACTRTTPELVDAALEVADAHALKLTEACLREDALAPDPSYRAAAQAISDGMKG